MSTMVAETAAKGNRPMQVTAPVIDWLAVVGNVALALKHPQNTGPSAVLVRDFAKKLVAHLVAEQLVTPAYAAMAFQDFAPRTTVAVAQKGEAGDGAAVLPATALTLLRRSEHVLARIAQAEQEPDCCDPEAIHDGVHLLLRDLRAYGIGDRQVSEAPAE